MLLMSASITAKSMSKTATNKRKLSVKTNDGFTVVYKLFISFYLFVSSIRNHIHINDNNNK